MFLCSIVKGIEQSCLSLATHWVKYHNTNPPRAIPTRRGTIRSENRPTTKIGTITINITIIMGKPLNIFLFAIQ